MTHERNYLLHYRQLLNVFAVDIAAKIEMEKLLFLKLHQKELRCDNYIHLKDSLSHDDSAANNTGQVFILPSTFTGKQSSCIKFIDF